MAMLLYGASASPFVRKVRVVLAEKGLAYEREDLIPINVSPEFRKISPLGKIPALRDGERTLADSSVICAYLERVQARALDGRHPRAPVVPHAHRRRARRVRHRGVGVGDMADGTTLRVRRIAREQHERGWSGVLDQLARTV